MPKNCGSCRWWIATEIHVIAPPEHMPEAKKELALIQATMALCSWAGSEQGQKFFASCPPWLTEQGSLTHEEAGARCPCWEKRPDVKLPTINKEVH